MIMEYVDFTDKLDKKICEGEDFYVQLLQTVIDNPNRYTGIFRISNVKTKLIQNVTQSNEIKFGDFMEDTVTEYLGLLGYQNLPKNLGADENGDVLNTDQLFMDDQDVLYLVEQKIRDDHDSTKKRGQFDNFMKKVKLLRKKYSENKMIASMWFIDDGLKKNKNFYTGQMDDAEEPNTELKLFYGGELFSGLITAEDAWTEITDYLKRNKADRAGEVLSIPDFDTSEEIFNALKKISHTHKNKLLSVKPEYKQLRKELFPDNINLKRLGWIR